MRLLTVRQIRCVRLRPCDRVTLIHMTMRSLTILLSLFTMLSVPLIGECVPVRQPLHEMQPTTPELVIPNLAGKWNVCTIEQEGRALTLYNLDSEEWYFGRGWINEDGSVSVWWQPWSNPPRVSVFRLDDAGILSGHCVSVAKGHMIGGQLFGKDIFPEIILRMAK